MAKSSDQSEYFNQQAAQLAAQVAAQAAQLEFQRMRFQQLELPQFQTMSALDKEKLAFQKATEVWNQAFQEASVTGSYNGVPAAQYLLSAAQLTGQFYQPGQLTPAQQQQYQSIQQQISTAQQQLMSLAPGTPEYTAASNALATARAQLAPLQQILQGTDKPPTQTLAGQNQAFQQQLALAGLTGIVPAGTVPFGTTPPPGSPGAPMPKGTPTITTNSPQYADIQARLTAGTITPEQAAAEWEAALQASIPATPPAATGVSPGDQPGMTTTNAPGGIPGVPAGGTPTMAYQQMVADLTGMFNGQATPQYQQMLANLTGVFNGQPTQSAMEFAKQFGLSEAAVTGLYNGQPTQAAKEFQQNLALRREEMENTQGNQLLQLAASLRGPRNAAQFAKVLGGTPGGLSDILGSVMGRYNLPSFQGGGVAPEAVNLQNFMQDVQAATPYGGQQPMPAYIPGSGNAQEPMLTGGGLPAYVPQTGQWSTPAPAYTVSPPGAQAPTNAYNYQPTGDGSQTVYPPGISAPVQAGQVSSPSPMAGTSLQQIGAQSMAQQPYMLPRPSQWNAEAYNNLGAYRQDLLGAQYEAAGWDPQAAIDQFKASLPMYSGPKVAKIAGIA